MSVVVTGWGSVSPCGIGVEALIRGLDADKPFFRDISHFDPGDSLCMVMADVRCHAPQKTVESALNRRLDFSSILAVTAARQAVAQSNIRKTGVLGRAGISLGSMSSGFGVAIDYVQQVLDVGPDQASPMLFTNTVLNAPASHVSIDLGTHGVNLTVSQDMTSGIHAVHLAAEQMEIRDPPAMITGGVEILHPLHFKLLCRNGEFRNSYLDSKAVHGKGRIPSEGAYILVLETGSSARERGADILLELNGWGIVQVSPSNVNVADSAFQAMSRALEESSMTPDAIGAVLLAENGVERMDMGEKTAVNDLFGDAAVQDLIAIRQLIGDCGSTGVAQIIYAGYLAHRISKPVLVNNFSPHGHFFSVVVS
jgi:3-oxoacyl-(acyl-carrier-protein) synthase